MAVASICANVVQALLQLIIILLFCYNRRKGAVYNERGQYPSRTTCMTAS
jgi:hypothetical protein